MTKPFFENTDFSTALKMLKAGIDQTEGKPTELAIQRAGWNGKNLLVKLQVPDIHSKMSYPYLYIEYPNHTRVPWLASQTDILANDWSVFEVER